MRPIPSTPPAVAVRVGANNQISAPLKIRATWLCVFIFVATLSAYFPAITGGFIWDDPAHVTKPELTSLHGLELIWSDVTATQQYYPMLHSSFWIEHRLWGESVVCYHLFNILLHASVACLVGLTLRRLSIPGAWLAAALFALHPVHVESVAWITEQKNTLSALFYLAAALAYLRFDQGRQFSFYLLALVLFVLGLLSKTVTATLPAALLVIFWWQRGRLSWRHDVLPLIPWFVLGALAGLFTALVERELIGAEGADFELSAVARCLLAGRVIWFYLGKLLCPTNLAFIYPRWEMNPMAVWQYLFPLGFVPMLAALVLLCRRWRGPLAGMLFFAGTLFPVLGFVNVYPFLFSFVADHFQYLASLGIIVPVSAGIILLLGKAPVQLQRYSAALPAALVVALGLMTWQQSHMYRDAQTLYRATIERNPTCWLAHNNLGVELHAIGHDPEAIYQFEQALRFRPNHDGARNNLGVALAAVGRYEEAIVQYEQAVRLRPSYSEAHHNLAVALATVGRAQEALSHYGQALQCQSFYPRMHSDWGFIFGQAGRYRESINHCQEALKLRPDDAEAHNYWGVALAKSGQITEAIFHFEQALKLNPNYLQVLDSLGKSFQRLGRLDEAIARFEQALRINPEYFDALYNLGLALHASGRDQEAVARFRVALRLEPDNPGLHYNLAVSLQAIGRTEEAAIHFEHTQGLTLEAPKTIREK